MISEEFLTIFAILAAIVLIIMLVASIKIGELNKLAEQAAFERDAFVLSHSLNRLLVCGEGCTVSVHFLKRRQIHVNNSEVIIRDENYGLRERAVVGFKKVGAGSANSTAVNLTLRWGLLEVSPA